MIRRTESEAVQTAIMDAEIAMETGRNPPGEPNPGRTFLVEPSSSIALRDIDPSYTDGHGSYERVVTLIASYVERISQLQYLMYAEGKRSLLVVLQGLDAAGKDGVIHHIVRSLNPAGCRVVAFKQPTAMELRHDFLWRIHPHVPAKGEVTIFNRSHYEDVLFSRVHQIVPPVVWLRRYELINEFERLLTEANETTVLKFFLHISKDEQLARFKSRLEDPARQWKISEADYTEREHWDDYVAAFEDMLSRTSTWHAPWFVVPANNRTFRNLMISQVIARTLEDLNMKLPEPVVDIQLIRQRHHAAECADERSIGGHFRAE